MEEELVVGVVSGVDLVEELNVVPVDQVADLLVHGDVTPVLVVVILEVRGLRGVREDVGRGDLLGGLRELNQPLLSKAFLHGRVVLPVDVAAVEVVLNNELPKLLPALHSVLTCRSRKFAVAKGTHH